MEVWKEIPGFEGMYAVSNLGNVKSLYKCPPNATNRCWPEAPLKKHVWLGYEVVWLRRPGVSKKCRVHRLVAAAFLEPDPERPYVNHKDKNRLNNAVSNLEWNTHAENMHHRDNYQPPPEPDLEFKPEDIPF